MWRAVICLCAALTIAAPVASYAQPAESDRQNPTEYNDEDSQPAKLMSYVLAPVGFVLEWGVTRPIHWIVTRSSIASAFNSETPMAPYTPPVPPLPPDPTIAQASATHPREVAIGAGPSPATTQPINQSTASTTNAQPAASSGQSVLH
ncbi:MAG TPA: hypothetical protein VEF03_09265 [Candidatus Binataceae bacterium]|nr:hypothetical protein [Candidatus Binataceae bacterium]